MYEGKKRTRCLHSPLQISLATGGFVCVQFFVIYTGIGILIVLTKVTLKIDAIGVYASACINSCQSIVANK